MKNFIAVCLLMMSGSVFAGNANFLPQCSIQSQNPYFQPDLSKPFYLARNSENQTIQYCNEESLLKHMPWIDGQETLKYHTDKDDLIKFRISFAGTPYNFSVCNVTGDLSHNSGWSIGKCSKISQLKGMAILGLNP